MSLAYIRPFHIVAPSRYVFSGVLWFPSFPCSDCSRKRSFQRASHVSSDRPSDALPLERDLKQLAETAEQRRRGAYDDAKQAILSQQHTSGILKLGRWFEARGWRDQLTSEHAALLLESIGDVAPGLVERRWRQSRKRSKRFDELTPPQRHKLRIAVKKLRYTIEFLQSLFDNSKVKTFMKLLSPLQDDLGQINDVRTAHELVAEVAKHANENCDAIARAGGIVLGWHDRALFDQEPRLRKHVRRLRRVKRFWPRKRVA